MKRILTLALALCLSLILVTALAVDQHDKDYFDTCLLYTSPSPRD